MDGVANVMAVAEHASCCVHRAGAVRRDFDLTVLLLKRVKGRNQLLRPPLKTSFGVMSNDVFNVIQPALPVAQSKQLKKHSHLKLFFYVRSENSGVSLTSACCSDKTTKAALVANRLAGAQSLHAVFNLVARFV